MPDIDPRKIRAGDAVRVRMHTPSMQEEGIDPIEFESKVYAPGHPDYSALCIAGFDLAYPDLTALEHIPARPDWADALVVRDRGGKLWARSGRGESGKDECWSLIEKGLMGGAVIRTEDWHGPATVVLDADGNPPEPEWLDADALERLPEFTLVLPRHRGLPRRRTDGNRWERIGGGPTLSSSDIAPARLLWDPEAGQ